MKRTNIIYWTFTIIFVLLMLTAAIPEILNGPDAVKFFANLGYPKYLNPFLGITKLLGIIAILVPGFPRIKEWAYAGFTFDLIGAVFSILYVGPFQPQMIFMVIFFIPLIVSYIYYHKKLNFAQ